MIPPMPDRARWIIETVAANHGLTVEAILSKLRHKDLFEARLAIVAAFAYAPFHRRPSLPMIGRWLRRDHTTILHYERRARERGWSIPPRKIGASPLSEEASEQGASDND